MSSKSSHSSFRFSLFIAGFFLLFCFPQEMQAQILPDSTAPDSSEVKAEWPLDSLGRRDPRSTIAGFLQSVADGNYEKAAAYLDVPAEATAEGIRIAKILEKLLNQQGQILPYSFISKENSGKMDDGLPPNLDRVGEITVEGETIEIFVEENKGDDGGPIWLFSSETLEAISAFSEITAEPLLVDEYMPDFLQDTMWAGVSAGHWIAMLLLLIFSYIISWIIISSIVYLLPKFWEKAGTEPTHGIIKAFALPIKIYAAVWLFVYLSQRVGISIIVRQWFSGITLVMGLVALLILLWKLTDFISDLSKNRMSLRGNISWISIILFLRRAAKVAIVAFGVIAILGAVGVDVTTGLAALGIGGIALALGAQKTVENFVGSVTLVTDQPVRVGDFCKVGDTKGTIEQIGMRSTRIRTLDRTIVTIPNGQFSSEKIENFAHRDRFWFHPILDLRYETTPDQIRFLLVELRSILYAHPKVDNSDARVRFTGLGAASLNLEIFAYVNAINYAEFLGVREDLLLRMMDKVGESGTDFAFPSQTLYFAKDKGLSKEKTHQAEEKVQEWKSKEELQLPDFDPAQIESLKDSIPYPPPGSPRPKEGGTA